MIGVSTYNPMKKLGFITSLFCIALAVSIKAQDLSEINLPENQEYDNGILSEGILLEDDSESELTGLIIDETVSKIGRDFTASFFNNWQMPNKQLEYSILIQEKPVPGNGSKILVYVDDYLLFQNFIQPRADVIEDNAKYATQLVNSYLDNFELIQQQLQGEDLSGTGIY